jgi:hypothetical protein
LQLIASFISTQKSSTRSGPLCCTGTPKSLLIFILLQRHIFPGLPPLPTELIIRILEEANLYRRTTVSSWKWPEKFDPSLHSVILALDYDWAMCISSPHTVCGPGLHPLRSIIIRWQWKQRRPSNVPPRIFVWLISGGDRRGVSEELEIVEKTHVQYHKIQRISGTMILNHTSPVVANAQAGDRVMVILCSFASPRKLTVESLCAW